MRLVISKKVNQKILQFYAYAIANHPTLDINTVTLKQQRLFDELEALTIFPQAYAIARYRKDWKDAGYRVFLCEDFHFAYTVRKLRSGEEVVIVVDVEHSYLYHD